MIAEKEINNIAICLSNVKFIENVNEFKTKIGVNKQIILIILY